jgi:hypothetical protein
LSTITYLGRHHVAQVVGCDGFPVLSDDGFGVGREN